MLGKGEADTQTLVASLNKAQDNISQARNGKSGSDEVKEEKHPVEPWHKKPTANVTADKGYHSVANLVALKEAGFRSYIPEKEQNGKRKFTDKGGKAAASVFHQNKAKMAREKGKLLGRKRAEYTERPNQHLYDRGDLRELTIRGQDIVQKRFLVQAAGFNLGLILRKRLGAGPPKWFSILAGRLLLRFSRRLALRYLMFCKAVILKLFSLDYVFMISRRKTGFLVQPLRWVQSTSILTPHFKAVVTRSQKVPAPVFTRCKSSKTILVAIVWHRFLSRNGLGGVFQTLNKRCGPVLKRLRRFKCQPIVLLLVFFSPSLTNPLIALFEWLRQRQNGHLNSPTRSQIQPEPRSERWHACRLKLRAARGCSPDVGFAQ